MLGATASASLNRKRKHRRRAAALRVGARGEFVRVRCISPSPIGAGEGVFASMGRGLSGIFNGHNSSE